MWIKARRLIAGVATGNPNYDEMSPALAEAVRKQPPKLGVRVAIGRLSEDSHIRPIATRTPKSRRGGKKNTVTIAVLPHELDRTDMA
jgi:hypothetical protein